ncbi:AAA family ATPase [Altericroceibacterium spongiae]|uniref:AAA family ATPase n=1 Tax=Altericroceibacterium spongiae TaxID=2320269 RepID=UPI003082C0D6
MAQASRECPYNRHVFIAPPWQEIYANDAERRQDWAEAVATHDVMVRVYGELGYTLVSWPRVAPDDRAAFVLRWIGKEGQA